MYCAKCGAEVAEITKIVEEIARKVCREEQHIENDRMRAIAREVLLIEYKKRILEEKDEEKYIPHTRSGEPWTECEDRMLKEELATFFTKTAEDHRRSYGAIVSRIKQIDDKEY
jgi:hypothetical protein